MKKTTKLRSMLTSNKLEFLMEAHSGLSARIAEEAGFQGLWGSGLSISASLGVRDNNEASWTQVLDVCEYMTDATTIPMLLDGDTGFGNFNNMRRLVKKLCQRGVAGVCIEDKIFPKTNSFLRGEQQPLADIEEFCGKIKAGLDARSDDDFCVLARVEAFIAGHGLKEALKRASAYHEAGADAILMHSKLSKPDEIISFMKEWGNRLPVVIVPTKYYSTPTPVFQEIGVSTVIWANHQLRASVAAMQEVTKTIFNEQSLLSVEEKVVSVKEIFRLQNDAELEEAEKLYLPAKEGTKAIILAAARGNGLDELTQDKPKAMLEIDGKPLLARSLDSLRAVGIHDISIVAGYAADSVQSLNVPTMINSKYETTGELASLWEAKDSLNGDCVIAYGDVLARQHVMGLLLENHGECAILVDGDLSDREDQYIGDFVVCSKPDSKHALTENVTLKKLTNGQRANSKEATGEWIGFVKFSPKTSSLALEILTKMNASGDIQKTSMLDLISEISKTAKVDVIYTRGGWIDVDDYAGLMRGQGFAGNTL